MCTACLLADFHTQVFKSPQKYVTGSVVMCELQNDPMFILLGLCSQFDVVFVVTVVVVVTDVVVVVTVVVVVVVSDDDVLSSCCRIAVESPLSSKRSAMHLLCSLTKRGKKRQIFREQSY